MARRSFRPHVITGSVRAPVQPTESETKVQAAIRKLFPRAELTASASEVQGDLGELDRFASLIRSQRIPDTARGVLLRGQDGARSRFTLSKQAAAAGRLNFASREGPLGDLHVELRAETSQELTEFIDRAAPDTRGWSLEERGLTEKLLKAQTSDEGILDELGREIDEHEER